LVAGACASVVRADDAPYFVTYTHQLEEQGNLEIENHNIVAKPDGSGRFLGSAVEFEYGLMGWWTTEFYLDGQATGGDGAAFTGLRWENRFRLAQREHAVNPVLYLEFEDTNGSDKTLLEVVGHDGEEDFVGLNAVNRREKTRELEGKLLLGSNWRGWNISENFIVEKNVAHEPWEFGYAFGVSRPLTAAARPDRCAWCAENFYAGLEVYGGLGDTAALTLSDTSHYLAPALGWSLPCGVELKASPSFGLTDTSLPFFVRFGVSYEIPQLFRRLAGR
jgi:hypothetical protein